MSLQKGSATGPGIHLTIQLQQALAKSIHLVHGPEHGSADALLLRIKSQLIFYGMHSFHGNAWVSLAFRKRMQLLRINQYDVIMSRALPDYAHLPALMLARMSGLPWIANWNDPALLLLAGGSWEV
jgi:hypothetical protein